MTPLDPPVKPSNLGDAGARLWDEMTPGLRFDSRELEHLALACHQADHLADLEAVVASEGVTSTGSTGQPVVHPAVVEARHARIAISRLLGEIFIPSAAGGKASQRRAKKAADSRWRQRDELQARREQRAEVEATGG